MKILHTESSVGWGGQELRVVADALMAQNSGHTVKIVCDSNSKFFCRSQIDLKMLIRRAIGKKSVYCLISIFKVLNAEKPDIVISHSSTDSWLVAICTILSRNSFFWIRVRHVSAKIKPNTLTKWLYRKPDVVVTTSEQIRDHVIEIAGLPLHRVVSIPTGIDTSRFVPRDTLTEKPIQRRDCFVVVMVATLRSWKGHRYAIEAIADLPEVHLVIAGDGPQYSALKQMTIDYGVESRVEFAGHVEDVVSIYNSADCFLQPSTANEGVSQSVLQAMACELPVIVSDIGGLNEVVIDGLNGLLVNKEDSLAIKQALKTYMTSPETMLDYGRRARETAKQKYSIEIMRDKMATIYNLTAGRYDQN